MRELTKYEIQLAQHLGLLITELDDKTLELIRFALSKFNRMNDAINFCKKVLRCNS